MLMGFQIALQLDNFLFCFIGVFIGTLVGVLPGLGPVATISLLLPVTYHMSPVAAIIMLAGIYYGTMYGGSTTSILVNIPGEAASVVTCLDGYQMARQGRAGAALGISAYGSFIGGTLSVIGLMLIAPPLSKMALKFGPPEYFSLMITALTILSYLSSGPVWRSLLLASFGLFLSCVGMDTLIALPRFTFGIEELSDGIGLVPVAMGLFGISEVLLNVEQSMERTIVGKRIGNLLPTLKDFLDSIGAILRGSLIGFFLSILPGGGTTISSFVSYAVEKRIAKNPEKFGKGAIQGVAAPESANNAATGGAFIPLLTLGIPTSPTMAILLGALIIYGTVPGPMMIQEHPQVFWGIISSMYVGNVLLVILNLPLIGIWVKVLNIPYPIFFPLILVFCVVGVYTLSYSTIEIFLMIFFGFLGYLFKKFKYEAAPLILALVLGPMLEKALRRSLLLSWGDPMIFVTRPISLALLLIALCLLVLPVISGLRKKKLLQGKS